MTRKKSSTATTPKNPTQLPARSACAQSPPQTVTTPFPLSQSLDAATSAYQTHSCQPSALRQVIPIQDGSAHQSITSAVKHSENVTFGSINDSSTPLSSFPVVADALTFKGVKSLGTVPAATMASGQSVVPGHISGKASTLSQAPFNQPMPPSSLTASTLPTVSIAAPLAKPKINIKKMFRNPSSSPSMNQSSETSLPSMQNSASQLHSSSSKPSPQSHPPTSQLAYSSTLLVPSGLARNPPNSHSHPSPPPTPSSALMPLLNGGPNSFAPRTKITLKKEDGSEIDLENFAAKNINAVSSATPIPSSQGSVYRQGSPGSPNRRSASIRVESEDQRKKRLEEEEAKQRESVLIETEAEEKKRMEKRAKRKAKAKKLQEEEIEKERIRQEEEQHLEVKEKENALINAEPEEKKRKEKMAKRKVKIAEAKKRQEEEAEKERIQQEEEQCLEVEEKENALINAEAEEKKRKEKMAKRKVKMAEAKKLQEEETEKERIRREEEQRLELEERESALIKAEAEGKKRKEKITKCKVKKAEAKKLQEEEAEKERIRQEEEQHLKLEEELHKAAKEKEAFQVHEEEHKEELEAKRLAEKQAREREERHKRFWERIEKEKAEQVRLTKEAEAERLCLGQDGTASIASRSLATASNVVDINAIQYPDRIRGPHPELNQNAKDGKFRYDREFLLQFMSLCKKKPAMLPPLGAIGLEAPEQHILHGSYGGLGHKGSNPGPPTYQGSVGITAFPAAFGGKGKASFGTGSFVTAGASKSSSKDRVGLSSTALGMVLDSGIPTSLTQAASQDGLGMPHRNRTRTKRPKKHNDGVEVPGGEPKQQNYSDGRSDYQKRQVALNLKPVMPLQATAYRWDRKSLAADADSPEMVDRKVKGLLNKLTMEKFDLITDQIIAWANKSAKEKDSRTLIQVIRLVFEKATNEAMWSEMYARLCRKMMEQISPKVQDDSIKNKEGKPIAGGQLFRKYLLNRCQEDFERGWVAKEATDAVVVATATNRAQEDGKGGEEAAISLNEYYAAQKARRQGLGLIKFIGELFKLQMLTERIMHECVKKLLGNVDNPEEEEIESLCVLLTTVGGILDTPKARAHLDVYFSRMEALAKRPNVNSRMQRMLLDLIKLRERKWVSHTATTAPTTIAQIHETAAREKLATEKGFHQHQIRMSHGYNHSDFPQVGPASGVVTSGDLGPTRPPPKAGDLSNSSKMSKDSTPMTLWPRSVFAGKKDADIEDENITRTSPSSELFLRLSSQTAEVTEAASKALSEHVQLESLVLQFHSNSEREIQINELAVKKKIAKDTKEFFAIRNLDKAEAYFTALPAQHHHKLVYSLVSKALESEEANVQLVADFFARSTDKCSAAAFKKGFIGIAELLEIFAMDAPNAVQLFVLMIKGAKLDEEASMRIAASSPPDSSILPALLDAPHSVKDSDNLELERHSDLPVASNVKLGIHNPVVSSAVGSDWSLSTALLFSALALTFLAISMSLA